MKRTLAIFAVLVALVVLSANSCGPYKPVTTYPVRDTRRMVAITFTGDALTAMRSAMDSTVLGQPEIARCLYGAARALPTHEVLEIAVVTTPPAVATDSTVNFECDATTGGFGLIGDLHTHPTAAFASELCIPSHQDFLNMLDDERLLVFYILCSNGLGYSEFRDGRWTWFRWKNA